MKKNKLPFSKSVVTAARWESYIVAVLLFVFVWFDKDISSIAILASLSWSGYRMVQSFYIWLCKHEHLMDKKIEYKKLGLDSSDVDMELDGLNMEQFDANIY